MLLELQVANFAIIDQIKISFADGLTVITGETGAGKSIIVDAIGLLAGGRGSSEYVRRGATKAEIEGLFDVNAGHEALSVLDDLGIDNSDGTIILRREIYAKGKSICRVNGKLVTLSALQRISRLLIDIHGQHEHQLLLDPQRHLPLIDQYGARIAALLKRYKAFYARTAELHRECVKFNKNEKEIAQRIDLLNYQINDIRQAQLKSGEEDELNEEKRRLVNFEKIFQALKNSLESLNGENRGLDWVRRAATSLESIQGVDGKLKQSAEQISDCYYTLSETVSTMRDNLERMEYDPRRLDEIEGRLNTIYLLKRKYGTTIGEILSYYEKISREYNDLTHRDEKYEGLSRAFRSQMDKLRTAALALSAERKKTIVRLNRSVNRELKDLYMEHAVFDAELNYPDDLESFASYGPSGIDNVEFYITTNPGEPAKPLAKIASGGELSRIMLAIKSNFRKVMGISTMIFDEIDTGVSGKVAQAMAEKIFSLSKSSQVLCITHLPQVAAMADQHLHIAKQVTGNRTNTQVKTLNEEEKICEIGRMLSGAKMTELSKRHAREMRKMAEKTKS